MQDFVGKQIDRYRIIERLGMGGMAVVYKAYDTRLERDVALKLIRTDAIPAEQHERLLKRFEREAKAQARFDHKHIVTVFDYGEVDGAPFLVMAYIKGSTLKARTGPPIDYQQAIRWILPIADALSYAHRRGVIHRDIKPSNILFDDEDQPILTDFGIAKLLETNEATLTGTGLGVGTPEYMAPEQWQGKALPATDQYALGVVLYELLTGQKPYTADTPAAIILLQASESLPRPSLLVHDIPDVVEKILFKALANKPDDRYADMSAFKNILEKQLDVTTEVMVIALPKEEIAPTEYFPGSVVEAVDEPKKASPEVSKLPDNRQADVSSKKSNRKRSPLLNLGLAVAVIGLMIYFTLFFFDSRLGLLIDTIGKENISTPVIAPPLTATISPADTPTPNPLLGIGSTMLNPIDGAVLVYVPEGDFLMGFEGWDSGEDTKPEHMVYLDAFWIYQHEVTNSLYRQCVEKDVCNLPSSTIFYSDRRYINHPVVLVNWFDASSYCEWIGGRLPTEAEWEKAARGTDGRKYPWGFQFPTCEMANFYQCVVGTSSVGKYLEGASPYGALDMAGNVWEWVYDWYDENYYSQTPDSNPTGPRTGSYRVLRGGSWNNNVRYMRVWSRYWGAPDLSYYYYGFRCVMLP